MKAFSILGPALAAVAGCTGPTVDGTEKCTVEAIGKGTGADSLDATLHIPVDLLTGVEISNAITVLHAECDFPLAAFFSDETARYIIENAPEATLTDKKAPVFRLVDASLSIWKFSDRSGETRFFVTAVHEMRPIMKARTPHEAEHFPEPANVR